MQKDQRVKVALVGAGGMGNVHNTAYLEIPEAQVAAVVDIRRERAEEAAGVHGAKAYSSLEELLDGETPDMLDICTPTYLHPEMTIQALNRNIHVLCEKPMALNPEDAVRMAEAAERNGALLMVGQVIRFWPEYRFLKKVYDDGTYGALKQLTFSRVGERPKWSWENWMADPAKSGRVPVDLHIHDTDFIVHMLGKPRAVKSSSVEDGEIISYIHTEYLYDNRVVTAEGAWYNPAFPFSMTYRAAFEKAVLEFRDNRLVVYPEEGAPVPVDSVAMDGVSTGINVTSVGAYESEIRYFIQCIRAGVKPAAASPESTVEGLRVVLLEMESARTGRTIYL